MMIKVPKGVSEIDWCNLHIDICNDIAYQEEFDRRKNLFSRRVAELPSSKRRACESAVQQLSEWTKETR